MKPVGGAEMVAEPIGCVWLLGLRILTKVKIGIRVQFMANSLWSRVMLGFIDLGIVLIW